MAVPKILFGCDPEVFVRRVADNKIVSAHDLLPGTKEEPYKVEGGAIQVDGTAAEFNTTPVLVSNYSSFQHQVAYVMKQLQTRLGDKYELAIEPAHVYDSEYFKGLPDKATELGCNPDYNAYTGMENDPPDTSTTPFMRTASGHGHIGWTKDMNPEDPIHRGDCNTVAKELDVWLGVMSLMWDRDPRRRIMYGKAGAIRYKPYGVEYRVMSNKWLSDPLLMDYIQDQVSGCLTNLFSGGDLYAEKYGEAARKAIDNNEVGWWDDAKHPLYNLRNEITYPDQKYWVEPIKKAAHTYKPRTLKDKRLAGERAAQDWVDAVARVAAQPVAGWPVGEVIAVRG